MPGVLLAVGCHFRPLFAGFDTAPDGGLASVGVFLFARPDFAADLGFRGSGSVVLGVDFALGRLLAVLLEGVFGAAFLVDEWEVVTAAFSTVFFFAVLAAVLGFDAWGDRPLLVVISSKRIQLWVAD